MAYKSTRNPLVISLCLALVLALFPQTVQARGGMDIPPLDIPTLDTFIGQVATGEADVLRGVYVPGVLASPVVPQPDTAPAFVSSIENTLTQFGLASRYGSIGLLAHNYLAGKNFSLLGPGQVFYLIYGDGTVTPFIVTSLIRTQALNPESVKSNFIDLDTGDPYTAAELFTRVYDQPGKVILQTCITSHGNSSWGRLFISAEPYTGYDRGAFDGLALFD